MNDYSKKVLFEHISENLFKLKEDEGSGESRFPPGYPPGSSDSGEKQFPPGYMPNDASDSPSKSNINIKINKRVKDKESFIKFLHLLVKSSNIGDIDVTFDVDNSGYTITRTDIYQSGM